ncbi:DUF2332 domain-containing protein [Jannaschia seohaensis]|uniref:DUF2332 domain-containing protein n=1 Tax=Jannaschia seohaensis TaxID=475081 RepID=A0A2Y9B4R9_9RHOB|nr:DUF2332 family protein [Jannaschia seohaensis]PWJ16234.1 hypothetical protein BCF38_109119 [Jannaschia seohaensis]SSA49299.1 hypothetical protein SAMN05421539_109119 [Jannaschia seohaensis]
MRLTEAFRTQGHACGALGSPFMARLMRLLADRLTPDHGPVAARLFAWEGDVSAAGQSLPLRLAGGLHALLLHGHPCLAAVYPPRDVSDAALWAAVSDTIRSETETLGHWLDSPPQTNELRRAAVLRAAGQWLTARYGLPLELLELGASAGLNLHWDRFALVAGGQRFGPDPATLTLTPDWEGPLPPDTEPRIAARRGVDLAPIDPIRDALRLRAYTWPDQPDRMARLHAALALPPQTVDRADAADWLEMRLAEPPTPGTCRLIAHTIAWQYFPPDTAARAEDAIQRAGRAATDATPLAWFGMEPDGTGPGAALTLRLWPGGTTQEAGRVDFHGRWVHWRLPQCATGPIRVDVIP